MHPLIQPHHNILKCVSWSVAVIQARHKRVGTRLALCRIQYERSQASPSHSTHSLLTNLTAACQNLKSCRQTPCFPPFYIAVPFLPTPCLSVSTSIGQVTAVVSLIFCDICRWDSDRGLGCQKVDVLSHSKVVVDSVSLSSWLHMWARMCKVVFFHFFLTSFAGQRWH